MPTTLPCTADCGPLPLPVSICASTPESAQALVECFTLMSLIVRMVANAMQRPQRPLLDPVTMMLRLRDTR